MRHYFYNIWLAAFGFDILERERREAMREQFNKDEASIKSYQRLVENLRERIMDANERLRDAERRHRQELAAMQSALKNKAATPEDNYNFDD